MSDTNNQIPIGYLNSALSLGMDSADAFLTNIHHNNEKFATFTKHLKHAPDGPYIIPKKKRNSTNNNTFYIISMNYEYAYALLATLQGPI